MNSPDEILRLTMPPLPDDPPPQAEARATVISALEALVYAIRTLEQSAWRSGYKSGWDKHHEWTLEQLKKYVAQSVPNAEEATKAEAERTLSAQVSQAAPYQPPLVFTRPAADVVYETIQLNPGLTGVEIVRLLEKAGTPINERTVRTALFRLKVDKIAAVENRWYTTEVAIEVARDRRLSKALL
jgi:hypothetical protein